MTLRDPPIIPLKRFKQEIFHIDSLNIEKQLRYEYQSKLRRNRMLSDNDNTKNTSNHDSQTKIAYKQFIQDQLGGSGSRWISMKKDESIEEIMKLDSKLWKNPYVNKRFENPILKPKKTRNSSSWFLKESSQEKRCYFGKEISVKLDFSGFQQVQNQIRNENNLIYEKTQKRQNPVLEKISNPLRPYAKSTLARSNQSSQVLPQISQKSLGPEISTKKIISVNKKELSDRKKISHAIFKNYISMFDIEVSDEGDIKDKEIMALYDIQIDKKLSVNRLPSIYKKYDDHEDRLNKLISQND